MLAGPIVAVLALVLAACPAAGERPWGEVTDVDRARYAELRDDPLFDGLDVHGHPGEYRTPRVGRGQVDADFPRTTHVAELHEQGVDLLRRAQRGGWTVYRAECNGGRWEAWAYRLTGDGVSLLLQLRLEPGDTGASLHLQGLAPQVDEIKNLLPERAPAVSKPCMRAAAPPSSAVKQGLDVVFRASGDPGRRPAGRIR